MRFHYLFFLISLVVAYGNRRLSAYICIADAYILADGARVKYPGKTFSDRYAGYVDARQDPSGNGTAMLQIMPECLRPKAFSVRANKTRVADAAKWIDTKCIGRECIVYTAYPNVVGRYFKTYLVVL